MGIKLNGATSGYVQIDAPAVAGSTQITLPATTGGSFVVSDSSGNVGIGTTTIGQGVLTVYSGVAGAPATTGSTDANIASRVRVQNVALDTGVYNAGQTWIQNRLYSNYASNFDIVLQPNGGNVQVGGTTVANTVGYVNSRTNARAWCNFNGTLASPITPRSNYNISSVTKNSTGNYTLNFTTALADANYSVTASANLLTGVSWVAAPFSGGTKSTSAVQIVTVNNGGYADLSDISVTIFGN